MSLEEFSTNHPFKSNGRCQPTPVSDHVIVSGFIREIAGGEIAPGVTMYQFRIDDGTGVSRFGYFGGVGDIKEGDKVFVEINPSKSFNKSGIVLKSGSCFEGSFIASTVSKNPIPTNIKPDATTPAKPEEASAPKTPGFEIIIGAVAVFFAWKKIIGKLS
jgi:hypothetical protein